MNNRMLQTCSHGKPIPGRCLACEKMEEINERISRFTCKCHQSANKGAKQMTKCCRNCTFFPVWKVKDKRGHVLSNKVALCTWIMPPLPSAFWQTKPCVSYTSADDGADCPCFEERITP